MYRAYDLKLGQPVALKFLLAATATNQQLLARFHAEVRIARQVSHPNVCRVYDIGEVDGSTFLSMEYVDGEDLRSLLRRIGRLPSEKALEIARKLCAGLAAVHDKGVLHRDLKPANVMIDGRGQVLITDFGLAALVGQLNGAQFRDGTPGYMAPEQQAGKEVSVRSDIYALGLVLHEMFTGKPAIGSGSDRITPSTVRSLAKDIDPLVERVILRCLDVDPRNRPASALAVAAALPGGDPLAAALAAGHTPTPDMVAASGDTEGISLRVAGICLGWILAGLVALVILGGRTNVLQQTPFPNSQEILAQKARETIQGFGYTEPPTDSAYGFVFDTDYENYAARPGNLVAYRDQLARGRPPLIHFWYRQSPQPLGNSMFLGGAVVSTTDPPPINSGMVGLNLDPQGRLIQLDAVPLQVEEEAGPSRSPDWAKLFTAAGLNMALFMPAQPRWASLADSDRRVAWVGSYPESPEVALRVEAASWLGKPVFFRVIGPWSTPERMQPAQRAVSRAILATGLTLAVLAALLAWRNFRAGSGDIQGASRLAAFVFGVELLEWLCTAHHVSTIEPLLLLGGVRGAVSAAAFVWMLYVALEPYVRRRWPQSIVSWSRVLSGGFRDPLVGGHLLFGVAAGIGLALIHSATLLAAEHYGIVYGKVFSGTYSLDTDLQFLATRGLAGGLLAGLINRIAAGMLLTFILMLLRVLLRRQWLAGAALILLWAAFGIGAAYNWMGAFPSMLFATLFAATLLRFGGLLPTIVSFFVGNELTLSLTGDFSTWYANTTVLLLVVILALTAYAFHTAIAGRPLFKAGLLEPD